MKSSILIKSLLAIFVIPLFFSCENGKADSGQNSEKSEPTPIPINENLTLPLDAETSLWNYFSQPAIIDGKPKLIWFNPTRYSIDYFDVRTQTLERKVVLEQNGPNAIPGIGMNSGIKYVNKDTVIIYNGPLSSIFLTNISGEVYKKIDLSDNPFGFGSIDLKSSIAYRKGSIYMQQLPIYPEIIPENFRPKYNKIAKIDLGNGAVEELEIDYPSVYYSDPDISQQLKMMSLVYNENTDKFIISFPLSDEIFVTDFTSGIKRYPATSKLVSEVIPIDRENSDINPSSITNFYYWMNDSYEQLIYSPENDLYLRVARKGISENDFENRQFTSDREFLVLNKDFKQIGTINSNGSNILYYFLDGKNFYWNKNLQKFNFDTGVEDSIFFQSKVLDF